MSKTRVIKVRNYNFEIESDGQVYHMDQYIGQFVHNKRSGPRKLKTANGNIIESGSLENCIYKWFKL